MSNSSPEEGRSLFFTPTTTSTAAASPAATNTNTSDGGAEAADKGASSSGSTYFFPKANKKKERVYKDKDMLNEPILSGSSPTFYDPKQIKKGEEEGAGNREDDSKEAIEAANTAAVLAAGGVPHFTRLPDKADLTNPVTGKSVYYGLNPWRCSDRLTDWLHSMNSFDWPRVHLHHARTVMACASSALGDEPVVPYTRLPKSMALFYKERAESGMMREHFWEKYPFQMLQMREVSEGDAVRMRTYRQQRHLEEVAKHDHVDDLIKASVLPSNRKLSDKLDEVVHPYTHRDK